MLNFHKKRQALLPIVILVFLGISSSLPDGVSAAKKKGKCEKPEHFAYELDYDWVMSQSKWYFPMMSKQDLLYQSSDILKQTLEEISSPSSSLLEGINSKACFRATWEGLSPIITGFNGKRTSYNLSPSDWTNFNILSYEKAWPKGKSGTLYITQSDNQNFVFFVRCWEDETRSWMVMTTKQQPDSKTKTAILQHLKLLGLADDEIETLDYEGCSSAKEKSEL